MTREDARTPFAPTSGAATDSLPKHISGPIRAPQIAALPTQPR
ncbi:hypothetical protein RRSWK_02381 [Rhodopirellula sp. SWK7]|nr:hypothetical protein RRSWK_02381 [Rhodopirellula sp. SWK7]